MRLLSRIDDAPAHAGRRWPPVGSTELTSAHARSLARTRTCPRSHTKTPTLARAHVHVCTHPRTPTHTRAVVAMFGGGHQADGAQRPGVFAVYSRKGGEGGTQLGSVTLHAKPVEPGPTPPMLLRLCARRTLFISGITSLCLVICD